MQTKKYADVIIPRGADNTGMHSSFSHLLYCMRNFCLAVFCPNQCPGWTELIGSKNFILSCVYFESEWVFEHMK